MPLSYPCNRQVWFFVLLIPLLCAIHWSQAEAADVLTLPAPPEKAPQPLWLCPLVCFGMTTHNVHENKAAPRYQPVQRTWNVQQPLTVVDCRCRLSLPDGAEGRARQCLVQTGPGGTPSCSEPRNSSTCEPEIPQATRRKGSQNQRSLWPTMIVRGQGKEEWLLKCHSA